MAEKSACGDFPENFVWGAASCPACCEGETVSDWARLSAPDGSVPDDGPRHWRRYRYDFRAMADMGLNAYRFGCDWGRLQRAPYAPFNRDDTFRYMEMLAELRSVGIEPWLVLFQNALPRWASTKGGWLNPETPHWFEDFSRRLADVTDGEVVHWITVHEPQVYALSCYAWGTFPGGCWGRLDQVRRALVNLRLGHRLAAAALRRRLPGVRAGISLPGGCLHPRRAWHPGDRLAAAGADWLLNRYGTGDFLNGRYGCDFIMLGAGGPLGVGVSDALSLSSAVSPHLPGRLRHTKAEREAPVRLRRSLAQWLRKRKPVYLTGGAENIDALKNILHACAPNGGSPAPAGFFYDPLLDQFDLEKGLAAKRGLLKVDFHSPDRRRDMRSLARDFAKVVRSRKL